MQRVSVTLCLIAGICLVRSASSASNNHRVQLTPHFMEGVTLGYRIETNTDADEHTTTPVVDSQSGAKFKQTTRFMIRLDVLGVQSASSSDKAGSTVRMRATFEKSHADSTTDAATPAQASLDQDIDQLEGHSFEFTLGSEARPDDVEGLDQLTTDQAAVQAALAWIPVLANAGSLPSGGIEIGQKWTNERPVSGFPLSGMVWRSESNYLRDESCGGALPADGAQTESKVRENCAVILTRFEMSRHGSEHSDATPDDYRQNGLRTSGRWTVSGESLNSISLSDGFLVSSTQTATQDMDYEIVSGVSGSRIHQVGQTKTQTEINLVREPAGRPH